MVLGEAWERQFSDKKKTNITQMSYHSVLDKSFALYPGLPTLIPGSPSLSDEALSHDLIF